MTLEEFKDAQRQDWQVWSQRIPADTTLEQAFYAGFVAGNNRAALAIEDEINAEAIDSSLD